VGVSWLPPNGVEGGDLNSCVLEAIRGLALGPVASVKRHYYRYHACRCQQDPKISI
jgi:hypothetical protein